MDAFNIRGMCRAVAYELLRYWKPGGTVFPSLATLAESLGLKPRMVRYHLANLERVGLWKRHGRNGTTNTYELILPGGRQPIAGGGGNPLPVEVTKEVTTDVQRTRCQNCGYSWPASYGTDCYRCLKRQNGPKPRGGMPEYHDRPPRADPPPLTAAQTADLEARAISDGYQKRAGQRPGHGKRDGKLRTYSPKAAREGSWNGRGNRTALMGPKLRLDIPAGFPQHFDAFRSCCRLALTGIERRAKSISGAGESRKTTHSGLVALQSRHRDGTASFSSAC